VRTAWVALAAAALAGAGALEYASVRNGLLRQQNAIDAQWANVAAVLQERADLMPRFVENVKGTIADKAGAYRKIDDARGALAAGSTPQEKIQAYGQLDGAFSRLLALTENYPKLRSDRDLARVEDEIRDTENRIAVERQKYNEALEHFNASIQVFPNNLVAAISGLNRRDAYFKTDPGGHAAPKAR
jgi:LemA protein